jgi:hypothetical protein
MCASWERMNFVFSRVFFKSLVMFRDAMRSDLRLMR